MVFFQTQKPGGLFFNKFRKSFEILFFYPEDIDQGSPKFHMIEIFSQPTSHKDLVILAFIEAELAGGRFCPPPLPVRLILDPILGRGLTFALVWGLGHFDHITVLS